MTGRALVFAFVVVAMSGCTSTQEQLAQLNEKCDEDLQCAKPLVCRCVVEGQVGDDGYVQILRDGICVHSDFDQTKCEGADAAADTTPFDSHLPPQDTGDAQDDVNESAADSGAAETDLDTAPETDLDADIGG